MLVQSSEHCLFSFFPPSEGLKNSELMQSFLSVQGERALFLACHRLCFAWIDEWYDMTIEQIREMERQTDMLLKKVSVVHLTCVATLSQCLAPVKSSLRTLLNLADSELLVLVLLQTLIKPGKAGSKHEGKRKTLKDEIAVVGSCT
jgi:hypothetical protein